MSHSQIKHSFIERLIAKTVCFETFSNLKLSKQYARFSRKIMAETFCCLHKVKLIITNYVQTYTHSKLRRVDENSTGV